MPINETILCKGEALKGVYVASVVLMQLETTHALLREKPGSHFLRAPVPDGVTTAPPSGGCE